jgi:hypothetical protein
MPTLSVQKLIGPSELSKHPNNALDSSDTSKELPKHVEFQFDESDDQFFAMSRAKAKTTVQKVAPGLEAAETQPAVDTSLDLKGKA